MFYPVSREKEWENTYDWFWLPRIPETIHLSDIISPETIPKPCKCIQILIGLLIIIFLISHYKHYFPIISLLTNVIL